MGLTFPLTLTTDPSQLADSVHALSHAFSYFKTCIDYAFIVSRPAGHPLTATLVSYHTGRRPFAGGSG